MDTVNTSIPLQVPLSNLPLRFPSAVQVIADRIGREIYVTGGGRYLITGFPGVGKTALTEFIIDNVRRRYAVGQSSPNKVAKNLLVVRLNYRIQPQADEVLYRLVNEIKGEVDKARFVPDRSMQRKLETLFQRIGMKSVSETYESTKGIEGSGSSDSPPSLGIKGGLHIKRGTTFARRDYTSEMIIAELAKVFGDLDSKGQIDRGGHTKTVKKRFTMAPRKPKLPPRAIVVIDEMDDLSAARALGNLFAIPQMAFLVLGTNRLQRQLEASTNVDTMWRTTFSPVYVPCAWEAGTIIGGHVFVEASQLRAMHPRLKDFLAYVDFRAQGSFVHALTEIRNRIDETSAGGSLLLDSRELQRFEFFAELKGLLQDNDHVVFGPLVSSIELRYYDQLRHCVLRVLEEGILKRYSFCRKELLDLVLRVFSEWDISRSDVELRVEAERMIDGLLQVLETHGYILELNYDQGPCFRLDNKVIRVFQHIPGYFLHGFVAYEAFERSRLSTIGAPVPVTGHSLALTGRRIAGHYQVLDRIGDGAAAEVLRAEDVSSNEVVAIKLLHAHLMKDLDTIERFRREAESLLALSHPNVIRVIEVGKTDDDRIFMVMEWIDGSSLAEVIESLGGRADLNLVFQVGIGIGHALEHIHSQGIIHRDLKPSNVLLTKSRDRVVLADFGIARTDTASQLTVAEKFIGTVEYVAPEQARGQEVDLRADLYCLGIILFEMVSGNRPFDGENAVSILYKQVHEPPPELGDDVPSELRSIIYRLLEKDPNARYQSASEFVSAFEQLANA